MYLGYLLIFRPDRLLDGDEAFDIIFMASALCKREMGMSDRLMSSCHFHRSSWPNNNVTWNYGLRRGKWQLGREYIHNDRTNEKTHKRFGARSTKDVILKSKRWSWSRWGDRVCTHGWPQFKKTIGVHLHRGQTGPNLGSGRDHPELRKC